MCKVAKHIEPHTAHAAMEKEQPANGGYAGSNDVGQLKQNHNDFAARVHAREIVR
jgi:hypothetical protein